MNRENLLQTCCKCGSFIAALCLSSYSLEFSGVYPFELNFVVLQRVCIPCKRCFCIFPSPEVRTHFFYRYCYVLLMFL